MVACHVLDVARQRLVDAQAVVGQQCDQGRRPGPAGLSSVEEALELVDAPSRTYVNLCDPTRYVGAREVGEGDRIA